MNILFNRLIKLDEVLIRQNEEMIRLDEQLFGQDKQLIMKDECRTPGENNLNCVFVVNMYLNSVCSKNVLKYCTQRRDLYFTD